MATGADDRESVPGHLRHLLDGPNTAVLVTIAPDGSPSSTPVWFLADVADGDVLWVSTRTGAAKHRNVERDPRVSLSVVDPANPMSYVEIRGRASAEPDPDFSVRDSVVRKHGYVDGSSFDPPDVRRTAIRIVADRVLGR
ncbi:MAG: PPOX class F420-dependent oxidoreductase [Actinomycetota bacterium]